jgi:hypothetical protein
MREVAEELRISQEVTGWRKAEAEDLELRRAGDLMT